MKQQLKWALAGIVLIMALATTQVGDSFITLRNLTAPPDSKAPAGKALLFVQNGVAKQLVGNTVTTLGSGSGGSGGEWSTIWPPTSIQNPVVGIKAIGPLISSYLPVDSVYNAAVLTPTGWKYFPLAKRPFP